MADDYHQALRKPRAELASRARADGSAPPGSAGTSAVRTWPAGSGRRAGAVVRRLALPVADMAALVAATVISGTDRGVKGSLLCALYFVVVLFILAVSRQHRLRICLRVSDQAGRIVISRAVPALALLAWLPASHVLRLALWSAGLVILCRSVLCTLLRAAHRRGLLTEPAVVVGAGTFGAYVAELMLEHPEVGLRPLRADVYVVPRLYELGMAVPRGCLDEIWGIPLIPLRSFGHSPAALPLKRVFDVVVPAVLFLVVAPLMLALALAVRLHSGQTALFRQARMTGQGRAMPIVKLRTLTAHGDHDTRWTAAEHGSRLGRWLRATHMDELPQLVNVMRGEMSLVGPRPERPYFAARFSREIPCYEDRNRMPAGMTGWAQVNGLNGDTSIYERARFDNYYVEYWSVWPDLVILARTLAAVIRGGQQVRS